MLQNSLELRKASPSCGVPLPCLQRLVLGWGPGRVRRRRLHTRGLVQAAAVLEREQVYHPPGPLFPMQCARSI